MKKYLLAALAAALLCIPTKAQIGQQAAAASNPTNVSLTAVDSGTCAAGLSAIQQLPNNAATSTVTLAGTFSATVTVRLSANGGATWVTQGTQSSAGTASYSVAAYSLICVDPTTYSSGVVNVTILSSTGSSSGSTSSPGWVLSRNPCGSNTACTQVNADGHMVVDATSNSTTTVTCPNSDCNFTSNDFFGRPNMKIGQKIWATTQGTGAGIGYLLFTTYVCPVTTVASFTANSVVLNSACTANGTANVVLYWGDDDGATLHGLDAAVGCAAVYVPDPGPNGEFMLDSRGFFTTAPSSTVCNQQITTSVGAIAPSLIGTGWDGSESTIMITPDAVWTDAKACTGASANVFIGCTLRAAANIQFLGSGLTAGSNSNCPQAGSTIFFSTSPASSTIDGVDVGGVCPNSPGIGLELNSLEQHFREGGVQSSMTTAVNVHASDVLMIQDDIRNDSVTSGVGLNVEAGLQAQGIGNYPIQAASIKGNYTGRGDHFVCSSISPAITVVTGGTINHYADLVGVDGACNLVETIQSGAFSIASGTQFKGSTTSISNSGTFISLGGNKLVAGLPVTNSGAVWMGPDVMTATCQGAPSVANDGFFPYGTGVDPNCTHTLAALTTAAPGYVVSKVPLSGSTLTFAVTAGTSGSATFDLIKCHQGSCAATALTCAMASVTFCADNTHFDVPVVGDTYHFVEVCAASCPVNVTATVLLW